MGQQKLPQSWGALGQEKVPRRAVVPWGNRICRTVLPHCAEVNWTRRGCCTDLGVPCDSRSYRAELRCLGPEEVAALSWGALGQQKLPH
eukprot:2345967-Pyramimonas_sp.AAC.1